MERGITVKVYPQYGKKNICRLCVRETD